MKNKYISFIIVFIVVLLFVFSCKKNTEPSQPNISTPTQIVFSATPTLTNTITLVYSNTFTITATQTSITMIATEIETNAPTSTQTFTQIPTATITFTMTNTPTFIPIKTSKIAAGYYHSMVLKSDGKVWVTGQNQYGQLGTGDNDDRYGWTEVLTDVSAVAAGRRHSLVLKNNGTVWATGDNDYGQLGNGNNTDTNMWEEVASDISSIACGWHHSLILKKDGTVWATGYNYFGQLGNGGNSDENRWVQVFSDAIDISAGGFHSLILKSDGSVWATGRNTLGQLGAGNNSNSNIFIQVLTGVSSISGGGYFSMAIKNDNSVWATGENYYGQLGTYDNNDRNLWTQVIPGIEPALAVAGGSSHSLVLRYDGSVWATGYNNFGQLGSGNYIDKNLWSKVIQENVIDISAGGEHSLALLNDGRVLATGNNIYGQLGRTGQGSNLWITANYISTFTNTPTSTHTYTRTFTITPTPTSTFTPLPIFTPDSNVILWDKMEGANIYVGSCTKEVLGTVSYTQSAVLKMGNCALFSPSNNYYKYNGIGTNVGTIEFWLKINSYNQTIMWGQWNNVYSPPSMGYVLGIAINEQGKVSYNCWATGDCGGICESNNSIPLNEWVYVAVTFGSGVKIYINGVLEAEKTSAVGPAWNPSNYLYLPPWGTNSQLFIDELIVSNIIRTEQDIQNRYYIWTH